MIWVYVTIGIVILSFTLAFAVRQFHKKTGWVLIALAGLLTAVLVGGTAVCWTSPEPVEQEADYGLLLGCGLENGQATPEMIVRCRMGLRWMEENPKSILIVSGGDPTGQGVTEAAVMAAWLRNHGADADYILLENRSSDTRENILFSRELALETGLEAETVTIITSDYHETRAAFLARRAGQQPACCPSPTPLLPRFLGAHREVYCFVSELLGV